MKKTLSEIRPKAPSAVTICPIPFTTSPDFKLSGHRMSVCVPKQKRRGESQPGHSRPSTTRDKPISLTPQRIALAARSARGEVELDEELLGEDFDHNSCERHAHLVGSRPRISRLADASSANQNGYGQVGKKGKKFIRHPAGDRDLVAHIDNLRMMSLSSSVHSRPADWASHSRW